MLIVEDSDIVSAALRVLFESAGRRVSVASTIAQAVDTACADRPDLMLLDVSLPDGDGLLILQRLRAADCLPHVTVALTGHDEPAIVARCIESGCSEVLLKPVAAQELLSKADEWLRHLRPATA